MAMTKVALNGLRVLLMEGDADLDSMLEGLSGEEGALAPAAEGMGEGEIGEEFANAAEEEDVVSGLEQAEEDAGLGLADLAARELARLECEEEDVSTDVVLFTFFMLFIGLVTRHCLAKVPIPYTGLLLVFGLILGFIHAGERIVPKEGGEEEGAEGEEGLSLEEQVNREAEVEEEKLEEEAREEEGIEFEYPTGYEYLGNGIEAWSNISPEVLLLIHLPALIFASGFSMDWHIFKRNFWQILILAGPGVGIGTLITAAVGKYIFPYQWCWPKALMFGAMMSATDPVAVVSLLKEVGASETLGTVIEGESLLNDGTAFVFFLVFRDLIRWTTSCNTGECNGADRLHGGREHLCKCRHPDFTRLHEDDRIDCEGIPSVDDDPDFPQPFTPVCEFPHRTIPETFVFFARMAIGAPVLGMAFGVAASMWINFVYNDLVVEVAITLVTAYLTYFTADDLLSMSGVLATVSLGVTMAVMARPRLSPKTHEPMEVFWELLEYFANTTIFIYAGTKIAIKIWEVGIDVPEGETQFIRSDEWGWSILLYLFLQVIRLVTILMCYPFLMLSGYAVDWKDVLVMTWGGLRGAVGLALSLIVDLDVERIDPKFRALTIFYMGLMAAYTLLFNGTSMPKFLAILGITKPKPEKLEVLLHVVKGIEEIGEQELREFEPDDLLGDPDPNVVLRLTKLRIDKIIPSDREVIKVMKDAAHRNNPVCMDLENHLQGQGMGGMGGMGGGGVQKLTVSSKSARMSDVVTKDMLVIDFRTRVLTGVKSVYGELIEEGEISAEQFYHLKESADEGLDSVSRPLSDWYHLESSLTVSSWRKMVSNFMRKINRPVQGLLFSSLESSAVMARSFIHAHEEATHSLHEYIQFIKKEQADNHVEDDATRLVEEASAQVLEESRVESEQGVEFVKNMRRAFPEVARAIKSKLAAWEVLHMKAKYVDELGRSGLIEHKEATALSNLIESRIKKLMYHPPQVELPESKDLLKSHPLFAELGQQIFDSTVWPHAKLKVYDKDQTIFEIGHEPSSLTLIVRGVVRVDSPGVERGSHQEGAGAMVGMSEVLLNQRRSRSLVAETIVEVYHIDAMVFRDLVSKYESVRVRSWQMAGAFLTMQHPWGPYKGATFGELQTVFRHSDLQVHYQGDQIKVEGTCYLAHGDMAEMKMDGQRQHPISAPAPLNAGPSFYVCLSDVKILRLPENGRAGHFAMKSTHSGGRPSVSRLSAGGGGGIRRNSLANLSMRPSAVTTSSIQRHSGGTQDRVAVAVNPPSNPGRGGLNGIPEDGAYRQPPQHPPRGNNDRDRDAPAHRQEPEPQWRLDQAVMSADMQFRQEAGRLRPQVTRASTGVTPPRSTYKEV
eukprot:evm.model.scf_123.5 EVM.evm.TU.scf_123.5   scf_123:132105-140643(-)